MQISKALELSMRMWITFILFAGPRTVLMQIHESLINIMHQSLDLLQNKRSSLTFKNFFVATYSCWLSCWSSFCSCFSRIHFGYRSPFCQGFVRSGNISIFVEKQVISFRSSLTLFGSLVFYINEPVQAKFL